MQSLYETFFFLHQVIYYKKDLDHLMIKAVSKPLVAENGGGREWFSSTCTIL